MNKDEKLIADYTALLGKKNISHETACTLKDILYQHVKGDEVILSTREAAKIFGMDRSQFQHKTSARCHIYPLKIGINYFWTLDFIKKAAEGLGKMDKYEAWKKTL